WEYACGAGRAWWRPYGGNAEERLGDYGWFLMNSGRTMHPVGQKKPNDLGLFDTLGNAFEWCTDAYQSRRSGQIDKPSNNAILDAEFSDEVNRLLRGGASTGTA